MPKVVIMDGDMEGQEFFLAYDFNSIGREEGVDIHLSRDNSVSRRHAVIRREKDRYILEDLGSTNGTIMFNDKGEEEEILRRDLSDGELFKIGKTTLKMVMFPQDFVIGTKPGHDMKIVVDTPEDFEIRSALDPDDVYSTSFLSIPEDSHAVEELNHKIKIFYDIGMALGKILDIDELFEKIIDHVFEMFPAQRGYLMLLNERTSELETRVVRRRDDGGKKSKKEKIEVSKTIINQVVKEKKAILSDDARIDERFGMPDSVFLHDIRATLYAPLITERQVIGLLCIDSFTSSHIFGENDLRLLSIIANQASQAIENARLHYKMKQLFVSSIKALANAIEVRDVYTRGHSERVTEYAVKIAEKLNVEKEEIEKIRYAALLHDIGKINIREDILNKPGKLTDEEFTIMKKHPVYGAKIMEPVEEFHDILPYVFHHHERIDKKGYPDGLGGEEIPLAARILAVADSFDAMTSNRPYRTAMSVKDAIQELDRNCGTQFEPRIVETFKKILRDETGWLRAAMEIHNEVAGIIPKEEVDKPAELIDSKDSSGISCRTRIKPLSVDDSPDTPLPEIVSDEVKITRKVKKDEKDTPSEELSLEETMRRSRLNKKTVKNSDSIVTN
jgi:putative nucleotidyltransferase with HDIG domain